MLAVQVGNKMRDMQIVGNGTVELGVVDSSVADVL